MKSTFTKLSESHTKLKHDNEKLRTYCYLLLLLLTAMAVRYWDLW